MIIKTYFHLHVFMTLLGARAFLSANLLYTGKLDFIIFSGIPGRP